MISDSLRVGPCESSQNGHEPMHAVRAMQAPSRPRSRERLALHQGLDGIAVDLSETFEDSPRAVIR